MLGELARDREVVAVDLPPDGSFLLIFFTPLDWAKEVVALLDHIGMGRASILGHSSGWMGTALEIAKLWAWDAALALAPAAAGAAARDSPPMPTRSANWRLGQLLGPASRHTAQKQGGTPYLTPAISWENQPTFPS